MTKTTVKEEKKKKIFTLPGQKHDPPEEVCAINIQQALTFRMVDENDRLRMVLQIFDQVYSASILLFLFDGFFLLGINLGLT